MFLAKNKELLEAFREGTKEAMEEVYLHYEPGVKRFLKSGFSFRSGDGHCYFKGIPSEDDLNVAVQEVFRRAFEDRARNAYNGINSFSNWVLAIARNMVINQFRNREVVISSYVSEDDSRGDSALIDGENSRQYGGVLFAEPSQHQQTTVEKTELRGLIQEFMSELVPEDKELLVLRFVENKSQEEAAEIIGSTRMKIRTAESKLRRRLKAFMRGTGYTEHMKGAE